LHGHEEVVMVSKCLRIVLLAAMPFTSFDVAGAPRYWTLTVQFVYLNTQGNGYFAYDDATQTISNWNVEVQPIFFGQFFPGFTYVPANSSASVVQEAAGGPPTLLFSATMGVPGPFFGVRQLRITPVAPLDGRDDTVSIARFASGEDFPSFEPVFTGVVVSGSLTLTPTPPTSTIVQVDEFYQSALRHYFITANPAEKEALDSGVPPGWQRTGQSFKAYARGSNTTNASMNPVCRFYSPAEICSYYACEAGANSHFFSADASECLTVSRRYSPFVYSEESSNAFQVDLPDKTTGSCPTGTSPVYRLWNQRADSNHRYTTSATIKAQMLASGYQAEGYGDGVVMCALQ
jgi:hypothetical protein